ncbi:MAG: GGDEF domain-containing protein [Thiogranum sp.]
MTRFAALGSKLTGLWSITGFAAEDLNRYAEGFMTNEVRRGVMTLGIASLLLLGGAAFLYRSLGFSPMYVYTCGVLALLALHVTLSSRTVKQTEVLYLLSITLLVVSGSAFVLLAHQTGSFSAALLSSVVLLFMVVPMVPWGLREASAVVLLIYLVFTLSTLSVGGRFDVKTLWILQFMMLGAGMVTLTIVARHVGLRKNDIKARFDLENAHQQMERLSYEDGLTGAWNRRFLDVQFKRLLRRFREQGRKVNFALLDVDDFKLVNDGFGHSYGDEVLKSLVQALRKRLGEQNYVFRVGGDEFALLFDTADATPCLTAAASDARLLATSSAADAACPLCFSIGVIEVPDSCEANLEMLYKEADKALYLAKTRKQNNDTAANVVSRSCAVVEHG